MIGKRTIDRISNDLRNKARTILYKTEFKILIFRKFLQNIRTVGWDEAIKRNKVEDWFIPKLKEHIERVEAGETPQDI